MNHKALLYLLLLCSPFLLIACSGESKSSQHQATGFPVIVFQEQQPENNGIIDPQRITLKKWSWNQDIQKNGLMTENTHYKTEGAIPAGLTLEIKVISKNTAELSFTGTAENHHVSQSTQNIVLHWLPAAFLASSQKALDEEIPSYELHIQFGVGYTIEGTVTDSPSPITLVLIQGSEEITEISSDESFKFTYQLEQDEPYEVMVKNHPEDTCCKIKNGFGTIANDDITNITVSCTPPTWNDPTSNLDTIQIPYEVNSSITMTTLANPTMDSLELISMENTNTLTHSSYKVQHNTFVHPTDMDLTNQRVLFKTSQQNAYINNFDYSINSNGHIIALITTYENDTYKLYTARYKDYFSKTLQEPTLVTQLPIGNIKAKVFSYDEDRGLITFINTNQKKIQFKYFNGQNWDSTQNLGLDSNDFKLIDYEGDVNSAGYGVFAIKYAPSADAIPNGTDLRQIYKVDFSYNSFNSPQRVSVGMYAVNNQGNISTHNYHCVVTIPACHCGQSNEGQSSGGTFDPICYTTVPIPQDQLLWNYDNTFFNSLEVNVANNGDADVFWYQRVNPLSNDHYLMHAAKTSFFWTQPFNIQSYKQIINQPSQIDSVRQGENLIIVQHANAVSGGYKKLILAIKNQNGWIHDGQLYLKYEPFSVLLAQNPNSLYSIEQAKHVTINNDILTVRAAISQNTNDFNVFVREYSLINNTDLAVHTAYDGQINDSYINSFGINSFIIGQILNSNGYGFFRYNYETNDLQTFSENNVNMIISKAATAPSCSGVFLFWNKQFADDGIAKFVSTYY